MKTPLFANSNLFTNVTNVADQNITWYVPAVAQITNYNSGAVVFNTTEGSWRYPMHVAGALSDLAIVVGANARTTNTTFTVMVNGVASSQAVTVAGGATGRFTTAGAPVSVAQGDLISLRITTSTGFQTLRIDTTEMWFEATTDTATHYATSGAYNFSEAASDTVQKSAPPSGTIETNGFGSYWGTAASYEGWAGLVETPGVASRLSVDIPLNTSSVAFEVELYKNNAATGVKLTIAAGATGRFTDTTHTVSVTTGDLLDIRRKVPTAGTGNYRIGNMSFGIVAPTPAYDLWNCRRGSETPQNVGASYRRPSPAALDLPQSGYNANLVPQLKAGTMSKWWARVNLSGSATWDIDIWQNGADTTKGLTVPLLSAGQTVKDTTNTITVANGDNIHVRYTPDAFAAAIYSWGFTVSGAPPIVNVQADGALPALAVVDPTGTGEALTRADGALPALGLSPPLAEASVDVQADGALPALALVDPTGTAEAFNPSDALLSGLGLEVLAVGEGIARTTGMGLSALGLSDAKVRVTQMGLLVLAKGGETPLVPDPLKLQDGGRDQLLVQRLVNMYVETTPEGPTANARFQRPGLYQVAQRGEGPVRATFLHQGFRYTISGGSVWRDSVNIGVVPADGVLRWAISDEEIVVVAGNRAYYITTTSVARINDPDLPFVRDVKFLAGRFVYFDADTGGMYRYSRVNDARSIDGLAFASAEANPDPIVGAEIIGEGMAIFGTQTVEWHYPTQDGNNPFQRSQGRTYDRGCRAILTVALADNALHFVGNDRIVYRASQVPLKVSTHSIEDKLRKQTEEEFAQNSAFTITFGGHPFYVLNIVGQGTWALNLAQKLWAEWKSWGMDRFRVGVCDPDGFMGDALSGRIMGFDGKKMTDLENDPIERVVSTFQPLKSGTLRNFQLALHCQQGVGLLGVEDTEGGDPKIEMRFSDHLGQNWSNWLEGSLGKHGVRGKEALAQWTNLGIFPSPGRAFEFRCTGPFEFTPFMVSINEWRP